MAFAVGVAVIRSHVPVMGWVTLNVMTVGLISIGVTL